MECLEKSVLCLVKPQSYAHLLQLNDLHISEEILVTNALVMNNYWYAKSNFKSLYHVNKLFCRSPFGAHQDSFIRAALPHLRLLTLNPKKILPLTKFMTKKEMQVLASKILFNDDTPLPPTLCPISAPRGRTIFSSYIQ